MKLNFHLCYPRIKYDIKDQTNQYENEIIDLLVRLLCILQKIVKSLAIV